MPPTGILLSEHTLKALWFIQQYRYLTVNQVAAVIGLQPKSVSELLLRLERQRVLSHFGNVGVRGYGKTPKVYYLTKQGHRVLSEEGEGFFADPVPPYQPVNVTARWSPKMYHRIATLDVMMAVEAGVAARSSYTLPKTFVEYRSRKEGSRWVRETTDVVADGEGGEVQIVPDAGFVLENVATSARALFLIEIDMGTETHVAGVSDHVRRSVLHKIELYDRYLTSGQFRERYAAWGEFRYFTTLIITNSDGRLANMRSALSALPEKLHQYYRLSTLEKVCGNFFHGSWLGRSASDTTQHSLIATGEGNHESEYTAR